MNRINVDVAVIGGGPAGLAAAISAEKTGANVLLIEREAKLGGILKQCIHDGFGLVYFKEKLAGPEYANRFIDMLYKSSVQTMVSAFVTKIAKENDVYVITVADKSGINYIHAKSIVLATGCRERTAKQIAVHGTRPSGVFTAGSAQYYTNILGQMPTKKCVILGSGDIGLIMARRLTLEGAKVECVCEAKPQAGGLMRNVYQCLEDFNIPLLLSHTVTRVIGHERVEAVEICKVDEKMQPIESSKQIVQCDALILSVGLIPENEIAESLNIKIDDITKGPIADQNGETLLDNVFICGNARTVNDLVDYVCEQANIAGENAGKAALYKKSQKQFADVKAGEGILSLIPQKLELNTLTDKTILFFRANNKYQNVKFKIMQNGKAVYEKSYKAVRPPEMERVEVDFKGLNLSNNDALECVIIREDK